VRLVLDERCSQIYSRKNCLLFFLPRGSMLEACIGIPMAGEVDAKGVSLRRGNFRCFDWVRAARGWGRDLDILGKMATEKRKRG